jgi:hypothetical protein
MVDGHPGQPSATVYATNEDVDISRWNDMFGSVVILPLLARRINLEIT